MSAIVLLVQDFTGTNNCPLLKGKGKFGSRFDNIPAAPRYVYAWGSEWLNVLFNKYDEFLYEYNVSDSGDQIEPK